MIAHDRRDVRELNAMLRAEMEINGLTTITREVVEAAREALIIGPV